MWLDRLPASVAFCDVETTGLGNHDRIVCFGGIGMISRDLPKAGRIWHICTWCSSPVRQTAAMPNKFMASRIRLCACKTRSQFMLSTYGAS